MNQLLSTLKTQFAQIFGNQNPVKFFYAPARVNLIGEHIDYNGGFVFPAALSFKTIIAAAPNGTDVLRVAATDLPGALVCAPIEKRSVFRGKGFGSYQIGVADQLLQAGFNVKGCDMLFWGDIPFGSGLSSSASIEVCTAICLSDLGGNPPIDMTRAALLSQAAENKFVGVNCGIMDQFAIARGKKDNALLLNCDTLEYQYVPLKLEGAKIVIGNTKKPRSLADSKYNQRRAECDSALELLQAVKPGLKYLCDLSLDEFLELGQCITDQIIYNRALHAVSENQRVKDSIAALEADDIAAFGQLMIQSHISLRDLYEVTGFELDTMFDLAVKCDGVIGTRMTGAGFGGCTVSIVKDAQVDAFIESVGKDYQAATGFAAEFYVCDIGDGAGVLEE